MLFCDEKHLDIPVQKHIAGVMTKWGVDYSFDCKSMAQGADILTHYPFSHWT